MNAAMQRQRRVIGWYGDDFTGATDTLAAWAERGRRAMLFMGVPGPVQLAAAGPLDAIGIAGATRSMAPEAAAIELDAAGRFFAAQGVRDPSLQMLLDLRQRAACRQYRRRDADAAAAFSESAGADCRRATQSRPLLPVRNVVRRRPAPAARSTASTATRP